MPSDKLIGLIYDAAVEPTMWPELLESLSIEIDSYIEQASLFGKKRQLAISGTQFEQTAFQNESKVQLEAHLARAYEIASKIRSENQESQLEKALLEKITTPAFLVDPSLKLVSQNSLGAIMLSCNQDISVKQGKLSFENFSVQRQFQIYVSDSQQQKSTVRTVIPFLCKEKLEPSSVMISALPDLQGMYLLIIATTSHLLDLDLATVKKVFGLTKAEARLANNLLAGLTIAEVSQSQHISLNTLRTQLKSVFAKTNTKRQIELVRKLLLYSRFNDSPSIESTQAAEVLSNSHDPKHHQTMKLADGRTLGFSEFGSLDGEPVIVCHPATGSRLQSHPDDSIAQSLNARLIIPDRPGYGLSSPINNATLLDWPNDLAQLIKKLQLSKVSIIGFCGGAPYALSCAHSIAPMVSHVTCISGVTPYDNINLLHGVSPANKLLVKLATKMPDTIFHIVSVMMKGLIKKPESYLDSVQAKLCKTDQKAIQEPQLTDNFILALEQAFIQGPKAFAHEQLLLSKPWPFKVENIHIPVSFWHGDTDQHVDITLAKRLADTLPNAELNIAESFGHFLVYHKWRDILSQHLLKVKDND